MPTEDNTNEVVWRDLGPVLDREVSRLPDRYREPFVLCYLEGKTNAEAARLLGCPEGTLFCRLSRARELLRGRLSRRGVALSSTALIAMLSENVLAAAVPPALLNATQKTAALVAAGSTAVSSTLSEPVAALVKGALHEMFLVKLKIAVLLLLTLNVAALGVAVVARTSSADLSAEGQIAYADDKPVEPKAPTPAKPLRFNCQDPIDNLVFSPDGKWLAGNSIVSNQGALPVPGQPAPGTVVLWNLTTGKESNSFPRRGGRSTFGFSPDGQKFAVIGTDGVLESGELERGNSLRRFTKEKYLAFVYAPDGRTLISAVANEREKRKVEAGSLRVWELATGTERSQFQEGAAYPVGQLALSADGKLLAMAGQVSTTFNILKSDPAIFGGPESGDGTMRLFDVKTGKEVQQLKGHPAGATAIAFAPNGKLLASIPTRYVVGKKGDYQDSEKGVRLKLLGDTWYFGDSPLLLWDTATGKIIHRIAEKRPAELEFKTVLFTNDGKTLIAAGSDGTIYFWDVASGKEIRQLKKHKPAVTALALSPDGKTVASASGTTVQLTDWREWSK